MTTHPNPKSGEAGEAGEIGVEQLGPTVLVRGRAVRWLLELAVLQASLNRRDGLELSGVTRRRIETLYSAAEAAGVAPMSPPRHGGLGDVANEADSTNSISVIGAMSSKEVAVMLDLDVRQAQRLAASLDARRVGRAWMFPAEQVAAEAARRAEKRGAR